MRNVQRTGIATLQWLVGLFCAAIGTLMLVAPHQFAASAYSAFKPHLPVWGIFFLVGGVGLLGVAALRPRRPLVIIAHIWAGLALVSLSGGFIASSHLPGISNYAILGLGTIVVGLMPRGWRERALLGRDGFATVLGTALIANGCYMLFWPAQYVAPIFDLVRPYLIPFGLGLVTGGAALIGVQLRRIWHPVLAWGAYLLPASVLLVYFTRGPWPYGSWTGTAYYGGFGAVLALLPWLGPRLRRIDSSSLRLQLALALIAASALPLVGAVAFVADQQERAVTERELDVQRQQAAALADETDRHVSRHEAVVGALAAMPALPSLPPNAQLDILKSVTQSNNGEVSFAIVNRAGLVTASTLRDVEPAAMDRLIQTVPQTAQATVEVVSLAPDTLPLLVARAMMTTATGEYAGQVIGLRDRERLVSLLAGVGRNLGGRAYMVDSAGQLIITAAPDTVTNFDRSQTAPVRMLLAGADQPGALIDTSDAVPQFTGYAPIPQPGWGVVVTRPSQVVLASVRAGRETVAWVLLLIVAVAAAIGVAVAGRLARPLAVLTGAVQKLTAGDAAAPLPDSRITEVAHLSSAFGEMRDRLAVRTTDLELALSREETLRRAGAALVVASDRESIYQAAVESALALARCGPDARATLVIGNETRGTIVAVAGDSAVAEPGTEIDTSRLPEPLRPSKQQRRIHSTDMAEMDSQSVGEIMGYAPKLGEMVLTPLMLRDELRGALIVSSDCGLAEDCLEGLATLASEVSLALESAILTEDLHRRRSEARFRSLVRGSSDIIMLTDADGVIQYASPSTERVLGYTVDDLVDTHLGVLVHPHDVARLLPFLSATPDDPSEPRRAEWRARHRNGQWLFFETIGTNLLHDPDVQGIVLNSRDVSERRVLEDQLKHQAFHDPLTRLPNRVLFTDRLAHALTRRGRRRTSVAVLFLALDNFKVVNDSLGHQQGDQLLIAVADRLQLCLRPEDTVARFGGDEMAVLLEDIEDTDEAVEVANRIQQRLGAPVILNGREVFTTVSIGVAISTVDHDRPDALIRDADVALYRAKAQGKARHAVFDRSMDAQALERLEMETDLRHAIERGELRVYYQPIVDLATGRVCEIEALIRWAHPQRGLISPLQFIPLAEETGLIIPIGRWVLTEAAHQTRLWQLEQPTDPPLTLSVNLSARQLQDPRLLEDITDVLRETGLDPATVRLEITESVVMEDAEAASALLRALKRLGIELAIDDFGTGYSSLSYLNRFTIDCVKIDRSFVSQIGTSPRDMTIIKAIVALAKSLDLSVTAEGIETVEQLAHLRDLGCNRGQGFYLSRPSPPEMLPALLKVRHDMYPCLPPTSLRPTA
jgi:diguanylate cyclase (GGDEF)-like protein/PAS domain S-box-containing protein